MYFHYGFCFCFFVIITWAKGWFDNLTNLNIIKKMIVVCALHMSACGRVREFELVCTALPIGQTPDFKVALESTRHHLHAWVACVNNEPLVCHQWPILFLFFFFFPSLSLDSHAFQLGFSSNLVHVLLINICFIWINL
jgi:hypothetical protein